MREAPVIPQTAVRPSERGFLSFVIESRRATRRARRARPRARDAHARGRLVEVRKGVAGRRAAGGARRRGAERRRLGEDRAAPARCAPTAPPAPRRPARAASAPAGGSARLRRARGPVRRLRRAPPTPPSPPAPSTGAGREHHRHLHQEAGLRLDDDGRDDPLRDRRRRASASASSPTSTSRTSPSASPGRAPRRRSIENEVVEPLEEALVAGRGRADDHLVVAPGQRARSPSSSTSRATSTSRCRTCRPRVAQAQRSSAARHRPAGQSPRRNPEDQPILRVGVSGPFSRQMLADFARYQVQEKLQTVAGVGEITLGGYLDRNVRIWLDAARLDATRRRRQRRHRRRSAREHVELPAGRSRPGAAQINVRVLGEALDLEELRKLVVARRSAAGPVYLEDVALVEDGFEDMRRIARLDGEPVQALGMLQAARHQRRRRGHRGAQTMRRRDPEEPARGDDALQVLFDSTTLHRGVGARDRARARCWR